VIRRAGSAALELFSIGGVGRIAGGALLGGGQYLLQLFFERCRELDDEKGIHKGADEHAEHHVRRGVPEQGDQIAADAERDGHALTPPVRTVRAGARRALVCRCRSQRASTSADGATACVSRSTRQLSHSSAHRPCAIERGGSRCMVWTGRRRASAVASFGLTSRQSSRSSRGAGDGERRTSCPADCGQSSSGSRNPCRAIAGTGWSSSVIPSPGRPETWRIIGSPLWTATRGFCRALRSRRCRF
jgi:hypothetical protein